jgi:LPXTG-motif cell wall-anchored protein
LADATYPPTVVKGANGSRGSGGTAFTGSTQLPFAMLMVGALVIAGVTALYFARRRRSSRLAV